MHVDSLTITFTSTPIPASFFAALLHVSQSAHDAACALGLTGLGLWGAVVQRDEALEFHVAMCQLAFTLGLPVDRVTERFSAWVATRPGPWTQYIGNAPYLARVWYGPDAPQPAWPWALINTLCPPANTAYHPQRRRRIVHALNRVAGTP